jgi:hypothetical protein
MSAALVAAQPWAQIGNGEQLSTRDQMAGKQQPPVFCSGGKWRSGRSGISSGRQAYAAPR